MLVDKSIKRKSNNRKRKHCKEGKSVADNVFPKLKQFKVLKYRCAHQNTQKYLGNYSAQGRYMGDMRGYGANGARWDPGPTWRPRGCSSIGSISPHISHIFPCALFLQIFLRILICASIFQYFKLLQLREKVVCDTFSFFTMFSLRDSFCLRRFFDFSTYLLLICQQVFWRKFIFQVGIKPQGPLETIRRHTNVG